ncbi:MAG TPA: AraC family transcriptional regulator [Candidatus Sulfomarinibacteraceae bacterium]|nr:AraC family transcriptional regulator [Candidatus Sulfomarinibacteraceae bacterium]
MTAIFARRMIQAAGDSVDGPAMLRSVGLEPDEPLDVTERISDDAYYDLLERIALEMDPAHELPLRVGPLMHPDDYGALGLAWKSAPTVRSSLERVERYCRLWTDNLTYEICDHDRGVHFIVHRSGERRLGMKLSNEATLASATSLIRQTSSPRFRPLAVSLKHAAPRSISAHERYFGCPVRFGSDRDALSISGEALARSNHLADDGISRFLLSHLDAELRSIGAETPIESLVEREVCRSLSEGIPRMGDVARRLAMSERTLHRRLSERGASFKSLLDATRRHVAENLLRDSRYTATEVAFLAGFSEQSAFNRAFKRWTGRTPTAYRKEARDDRKKKGNGIRMPQAPMS